MGVTLWVVIEDRRTGDGMWSCAAIVESTRWEFSAYGLVVPAYLAGAASGGASSPYARSYPSLKQRSRRTPPGACSEVNDVCARAQWTNWAMGDDVEAWYNAIDACDAVGPGWTDASTVHWRRLINMECMVDFSANFHHAVFMMNNDATRVRVTFALLVDADV